MEIVDERNFRVDIGRADNGRTFVRVLHLPSGKEKIAVGLNGCSTDVVAQRLQIEVLKELGECRSGTA